MPKGAQLFKLMGQRLMLSHRYRRKSKLSAERKESLSPSSCVLPTHQISMSLTQDLFHSLQKHTNEIKDGSEVGGIRYAVTAALNTPNPKTLETVWHDIFHVMNAASQLQGRNGFPFVHAITRAAQNHDSLPWTVDINREFL